MYELNIPEESFIRMAESCIGNATKVLEAIIPYGVKEICDIFALANEK
jgi:hypothetical protein